MVSPTLKRALTKLPLLVCVGVFLFHFNVVRKYAVNIPYYDDWAMFAGDSHPASLDLPWLYAQHNEQRTATAKLFVWLQFQLNGWNIRTHYLIAFVTYGVFLAFLTWAARKWAADFPAWVIVSFIVFLLSPIIWLVHFMAYASVCFFWIFGFLVSAYLLFDNPQRWPALIVGCLASIAATYSAAFGFVTSFVLLLVFSLFKCVRLRELADKRARVRELGQLLMVALLIGGALATWVIGFQKPLYHPPLVFPYRRAFWSFFLNLVAFSFGVDWGSTKLGVFCLLIVLAPICGCVWKQRGKLSTAQWATFAVVTAILADLSVIAIGRAAFDVSILAPNLSGYASLGMPLIILAIVNWSIFFRDKKMLRIGSIAALWVFCLIAFHDNWDFDIYRNQSTLRMTGMRCVRTYYQQIGPGLCPTIYPFPLAPFLDQAKRLNASFYQDVVKADRKTSSGPPAYFGAHDVADCHHIAGWAYDKSDPDAVVAVAIYDGDSLLATLTAIDFRPDLLNAGIGNGFYSFEYITPPTLKDGQPHSIRVKFAGTAIDLANTPKSLVCTP